ncbi:MAG: cupin domain-containing protein [Stellaceae bacterium]
MMTRREAVKAIGGSALLAQFFAALAMAQTPSSSAAKANKAPNPLAGDKGVTVRPVMEHDLPDAPGKKISVVMVEFQPGAGNSPHRHPGSTIAYVLEGSVVSQVDPGQPVTYRAGQSWYERPMHTHRIVRNASKTRGARILAVLISEKGEELVLPPQ